MSNTSPRTLVDHALDAVRRGFAVIPLIYIKNLQKV
jgi:hypothetical protein